MMMRRGPGLLGMMARTAVVAGTATAVSGGMRRRQEQKTADQQQQYAPQPAPAPAAADDNPVDELQKLAQMAQQGLLSPEEFAAAKAKLLGT